MHDVIVIGAGPAGSEVAYRLASFGYDVLVLEKDRLDREKVCGGGIQRVELDEFGKLPDEIIERQISNCLLVSRKLNLVTLSINPSPVTVMRSKYDQWLQTRARSKGTTFLQNTTVKKVMFGSNPEIFLESGDSLAAKLLVDASGSASIVRKSLGLSWRKEEIATGVQYHIELPPEEIDERIGNCCEFYFDSSSTQEGYYWIFPKKETVAVGIEGSASLVQSGKVNLREQLDIFVKHHPIASPKLKDGNVKLLQSGIMPIKVSEKLVYKNALIVGDAGGLGNPLHKGGIFPARKSAEIASKYAKAFLESGREEQLHGYESEIRHEFYEQNYRYDRLIQNIFADDEIVDRLIQRANEKQNLSESFKELLMFFSHKKVYDSMKRDVAETISEIYPMSPAEATRNLIMIPRNLTFDELVFDAGKTLVAVSYCVKSFGCPKERFSLECDETCDLCNMSQLRRTSANMGFDFRIATDDDRFIEFLEDNYEKYKSLIAIVCPYTTNKIGYAVHKIFGLKGVVIPLRGDVCTSEDKYMKGMKGEKASQTKTDLQTFFGLMDRIRTKKE